MLEQSDSDREQKFNEIVAAYLDAAEAGAAESWHDLQTRHPDFSDDIAEFFAGQEDLSSQVAPLRVFVDAAAPSQLLAANSLENLLLAKASGDSELTRTGIVAGTLRYLPPERLNGQSDARSDVYSLGLTLYEMLTLQPAFAETKQDVLMQQVAHLEPARPRQVDPRIPRDLETIVLKSIAKDPAQRYASALELAEDLRRFLADRPILARRTTALGRAWRWCRRNPTVATLLGSVVLLLATLVVHDRFNARWLADERDNVAKERNVALANLRDSYLAQAQARRWSGLPGRRFTSLDVLSKAAAIRPGLDLRNEAIACMPLVDLRIVKKWDTVGMYTFDTDFERYTTLDEHGNIRILRLADDVEIACLPTQGGPCTGGYFSQVDIHANGRLAATPSEDGVHLWNLESGLELAHLNVGRQSSALFRPAGDELITSGDQGIYRWPLQFDSKKASLKVGPPRLISPPPTWHDHFAHLSRDGRWLCAAATPTEILVHDLNDNKEPVRLSGHRAGFATDISPDGRWVVTGTQHGRGVKVWNAHTGKLVKEIECGTHGWGKFTFDGRKLVTGSSSDIASRSWDVASWQEMPYQKQHGGDGVFSDDGRLAALPRNRKRAIELVDVSSGEELATLVAPDALEITGLRIAPDGARLVAACAHNNVLQVWDLRVIRKNLADLELAGNWPIYPAVRLTVQSSPLVVEIVK